MSLTEEMNRIEGRVEVVIKSSKAYPHGKSEIGHLYQRQPSRLFFPHTPGVLTAVLGNISGGMVGGDRYSLEISIEQGAALLFTGQAAEKVYRSSGSEVTVETMIHVGSEAALSWLPQGTILFNGCKLRRYTAFDLDKNARLLVGEIVMFGRRAMGEKLSCGFFHDDWRVRVSGRLVWADAFRLEGETAATLAHPAALAGSCVMANCIYVADNAISQLDFAREIIRKSDSTVRTGVSAFNGALFIRWLGDDGAALRRSYGDFWSLFAERVSMPGSRLPTIWYV